MKKEKLAKMNLRELKKRYKSEKIASGLLTAIVLGLFLVIFVFKPETSTASKILPFAFLPLIITSILSVNRLKKELNERLNKQNTDL